MVRLTINIPKTANVVSLEEAKEILEADNHIVLFIPVENLLKKKKKKEK